MSDRKMDVFEQSTADGDPKILGKLTRKNKDADHGVEFRGAAHVAK